MVCNRSTEQATQSSREAGGSHTPAILPHWHPLVVRGFINPLWFNRLNGTTSEAVVIGPGQIELQNVVLTFDPQEIHLKVGTSVVVRVGRKIEFITAADHLKLKEIARQKSENSEQAYREMLNGRRKEAEAFNSQLNLPFAWGTAIKPVLSGLMEGSVGDGASTRTVVHIRLKDAFSHGRLRRNSGDLLCSTSWRANGKYSSDIGEFNLDGQGIRYMPKVTCKRCLEIAYRLIKSHNSR